MPSFRILCVLDDFYRWKPPIRYQASRQHLSCAHLTTGRFQMSPPRLIDDCCADSRSAARDQTVCPRAKLGSASFKRTSVQKRTRDEEQRKKYRSCSAGARELLTLLFYFQFYRCGHHSPRSTARWWLMRTKFFRRVISISVLSWKSLRKILHV